VEVLDENGSPIDGFDAQSCQPISTDTLLKTADGWIHWKNQANLGRLRGQQIRLRFKLRNASLYSFRVADADTTTLPIPRATDR
jgi:hypothetical protein